VTDRTALTPVLDYPDVAAGLAWLVDTLGFTPRDHGAAAERGPVRVDLVARTDDGPPGPARLRLTVPELPTALRPDDPDGGVTVVDPGGHRWTVLVEPDDAGERPVDRLGRLTDLLDPFAVRVAATLGIAELIESGVSAAEELAEKAGADQDALTRLLRHLGRRGLFTEPEPGRFALTPTGRLLADRGPAGQGNWLDLAGPGARMDLVYTGLLHSIRTGEPAYPVVHGRTFWADLDALPEHQRYFDALMTAHHDWIAPQVARRYDFTAVRHLVDVGGGSGALLTGILREHPHLRATLLDRPSPAELTADRFAGTPVAGRARVVAADFFGELPTGGDVYLISRALTDWDDRSAEQILRRCATAAAGHPDGAGRVLIVEVLPTDPFVPHQAPFDLQMLVTVGGRERSVADFAALADRAGLDVTQVLRGTDGLLLVECAPRPRSGGR
jgi:hypothetical protein